MEKTGNYELLYIVHPDLESTLDKVTSKIKGFIETKNGKITYEEDWGKKKLAYEINKSGTGIYVLWYFEIPKEKLSSLGKDLRISEEIMRFFILKLEEKKTEITKEKETNRKTYKSSEKKIETKESEKERMKKIDKKIGELLDGKENDTKEREEKEKGGKKWKI